MSTIAGHRLQLHPRRHDRSQHCGPFVSRWLPRLAAAAKAPCGSTPPVGTARGCYGYRDRPTRQQLPLTLMGKVKPPSSRILQTKGQSDTSGWTRPLRFLGTVFRLLRRRDAVDHLCAVIGNQQRTVLRDRNAYRSPINVTLARVRNKTR